MNTLLSVAVFGLVPVPATRNSIPRRTTTQEVSASQRLPHVIAERMARKDEVSQICDELGRIDAERTGRTASAP